MKKKLESEIEKELNNLKHLLYEDTFLNKNGDFVIFENSKLFDVISKLHLEHYHDHDYRIVS